MMGSNRHQSSKPKRLSVAIVFELQQRYKGKASHGRQKQQRPEAAQATKVIIDHSAVTDSLSEVQRAPG